MRLLYGFKDFLIQTFVPSRATVVFNIYVFLRLTLLYLVDRYFVIFGPLLQ